MRTLRILICGLVCFTGLKLVAGEQREIERRKFDQQVEDVEATPSGSERLRRAKESVSRNWYSSAQIKIMAARLPDDDARLDFATFAFSRTIDPENFYEVYDAFSSFSKVFRLHDRIQRPPAAPFGCPVVEPLSSKDFAPIREAIKRESFDNGRLQLARQIFATSRRNFLSAQIRDLAQAFDFEPARLEFAKLAFDHTLDPEKYFIVGEAFSFQNSKDSLSKYVEERSRKLDKSALRR